ncbi:MAG: tetratricopeptide repeat protein [Bacteroidales bacterium]|nr:tetratricopeptide repeat protein [Bacteroidales bacterium]
MKKIIIPVILMLLTAIVSGQKPVDHLLKAKALTESGNYDEAIRVLSDVIGPGNESILLTGRAEVYMAKGDLSAAVNDLNSANIVSPGSGEYGLSRIYAIRRDVATSLYHLERNLKSPYRKSEKEIMLDPAFSAVENSAAWRQFWRQEWYSGHEKGLSEIEYYVSRGSSEEARTILSGLMKDYPGYDDNIYAGALISMAGGNYTQASAAMAPLTAKFPSNEKYLRLYARIQEELRNPSCASVTYTRLLDLNIPDAALLLRRADCYRKTGETTRSRADVSKYLELYPGNKEALRLAGMVESAAGDNLRALEYYSKNVQLHPGDPDCFIDRANAYFVSRSWDWAIRDYGMALDLKPDNPEAWLNKGISLLNSGKREDACHDFRRAFRLGSRQATEYISKNCIR